MRHPLEWPVIGRILALGVALHMAWKRRTWLIFGGLLLAVLPAGAQLVVPQYVPSDAQGTAIHTRGTSSVTVQENALAPLPAPVAAPKRRPWYKSKQFWLSTAVSVGMAVLDGESTVACLRKHWDCEETNPLLGKRPSRGRIYGVGLGSIVVERAIVIAFWRRDEQNGQIAGWLTAGARTVGHGIHAANNFSNAAQPVVPPPTAAPVCPANGAGCVR